MATHLTGKTVLPTVVARLTARSSLPPPEINNRTARAEPALGAPVLDLGR